MMKKIWILAALGVALSACNDGIVERNTDSGDAVIEFAARAGEQTRGEVITGATIESFQVWTYAHDGDWPGTNSSLIVSGPVTDSDEDGIWEYYNGGVPAFWPYGKKVSAFAYAPAGALTPPTVTSGVPAIQYTVPGGVGDQVDLLIAATTDREEGNGAIPMTFQHALAQIKLQALKVEEDFEAGDVVKLTGVKFQHLVMAGTTLLDGPDWTFDENERVEYPLSFDMTLGITAAEVFSGESMFLIPQELEDVQLVVEYSINGVAADPWVVPIPTPAWGAGESYTYTLRIGQEVELGPWEYFVDTADKTFVVPKDGYYYIEAWGGDGGKGGNSKQGNTESPGVGGGGGLYQPGFYWFEAGQTLHVQVGGAGVAGVDAGGGGTGGSGTDFAGGDGGAGDNNNTNGGGGGGGGGGASAVFLDGTVLPANLILVAAGGGGGGGGGSDPGNNGGNGGLGSPYVGGMGGIATANQAGGGGGGGGGYMGGAGGSAGGGKGNGGNGGTGENYDNGQATNTGYETPTNTRAGNGGNGYVIITFLGE